MNTRYVLIAAILFFGLTALTIQTALADNVPVELKSNATTIKEIVSNPSAFNGQEVVIEGKIQTECPAGCWFIVDDDVASIYVDILPSNFVIPQEAGSSVKVFGTATEKDKDPMIIGKIVEINGEIYR